MTRTSGWVPHQHGAWAMLAVPAVVGTTLLAREATLTAAVVPLLAGWLAGYLCFSATCLWLKGRRRARYRTPVVVYGALTAVLAVATLVLAPQLARWAPAFVPLLAVGLWEAAHRRERSLLSGVVTVVAACLLVPVLRGIGPPSRFALGLPVDVLVAWSACTLYFLGTVLVVKTMIRRRGSLAWLASSVGYHAAASAAMSWLLEPTLAWFFVAATVRAALLPWLAHRGLRIRPVHVGIVEIVLSAVLTVLLLS